MVICSTWIICGNRVCVAYIDTILTIKRVSLYTFMPRVIIHPTSPHSVDLGVSGQEKRLATPLLHHCRNRAGVLDYVCNVVI